MLKNKRIVVLGGTSGIGRAIAEQAASEGARVVVGSSSQRRVEEARAAIEGAEGHAVDLRSEEGVAAFFAKVGAFDHLVYTAGEELLLTTVATVDLAKARQFFELRYWGALAAVKAATPHLSRDGSIVLTSGTAGTRPHPGLAIAASLCGAMESLTRVLAVELAPIRVNVVVPGFVDTGLWSNVPKDALAKMFADAAAKLPVGRIGAPADIAEHYVSFMKARYTTGQSIIVDGGGVLV
jgi:NAD(P)-dependent dehydrogenase (short-subunit alcohol dehydrogenase family)